MRMLETMIDQLSTRADDCDLIALLAASDHARRYNLELARELRDVVVSLRLELGLRETRLVRQAVEIREPLFEGGTVPAA